jgi:hypothetical protein
MELPNWIRWLLFLPASLVALFVVYTGVILLNKILYAGLGFMPFIRPFINYFLIIIASAASAYAFVRFGAKVAPNYKYKVSIILTVIYFLLAVLIIISKIIMGDNVPVSWFEAIPVLIAGLIAATDACNEINDVVQKQERVNIQR